MTLTNNQKIYIYGGSFNPPTIAHQAIAEACLAQPECKELWIMPSGERTDKSMGVDVNHRMNLLNEFIGSFSCNKSVQIETLEIEREGLTQTHVTVELLQDKYPDKEFRYIFGSDSYNTMHTWTDGLKLKENLDILIIPRDGEVVKDAPNIKILKKDIPGGISSTGVKDSLNAGKDISQFVSSGVERYIRRFKLYVQ